MVKFSRIAIEIHFHICGINYDSKLIFVYHKKITLMAFPTSVNDQITDSVTQTNVKVSGESPAEAMANQYQNESESTEATAQNASSSDEENKEAAE